MITKHSHICVNVLSLLETMNEHIIFPIWLDDPNWRDEFHAQALWLCCQVCACSVCCVMVGMCLAVVSWQSKNGLLVTLPPSQPVAGLRLHHLQLLPAVAQLWCLMVEMRLAVDSWQSKNCLLRYSRSTLPILIKMRFVVAELCWSGPFRSRPRSIPFHTRSRPGPPMYHPWPTSACSHIDCS